MIRPVRRLLDLLFPPKCVFCRSLLPDNETELCHACRERYLSGDAPPARRGEPAFTVCCSAVYYEDDVAASFKRFKFDGMQGYAACYGRLLAMALLRQGFDFDVLTYVPISDRRRRKRGYDQTLLLARATAGELGVPCVQTLRKVRDIPAQSGLRSASERRGNVKNVYRALHPEQLSGKRVLLIDDLITTGATLSEAAQTLRFAGASAVCCATLAATRQRNSR